MLNTAFSALLAMNDTKHLTAGLKKLLEMYKKISKKIFFIQLTGCFA